LDFSLCHFVEARFNSLKTTEKIWKR
jgi:hypothetical protein